MGIAPSRDISLVMKLGEAHTPESIQRYAGYLRRLARVSSLSFTHDGGRPAMSASAVVDGEELYVPLQGIIDIDVEKARLRKEIDRLAGMVQGVRHKLSNEDFLARAPREIVQREKEKLDNFSTTLEKLQRNLQALSGQG
jgi:valyl-tRNA synthetase